MNLVNLVLDGNETRTIRDTRLNIEGIIEVKENATLILENVNVYIFYYERNEAVYRTFIKIVKYDLCQYQLKNE